MLQHVQTVSKDNRKKFIEIIQVVWQKSGNKNNKANKVE